MRDQYGHLLNNYTLKLLVIITIIIINKTV